MHVDSGGLRGLKLFSGDIHRRLYSFSGDFSCLLAHRRLSAIDFSGDIGRVTDAFSRLIVYRHNGNRLHPKKNPPDVSLCRRHITS